MGAYARDWDITQRLEAKIGCKVSELTAAEVSEDDLVKVDGCRPWESRTLPKKRTMKDESGERVKKKRRDEGKKPATCSACGNKFLTGSTKPGATIRCVRGTKSGCGSRGQTKLD